MTNWDNVRVDYVSGLSVPDLGRKYNLKLATIRQQIARKGWASRKREIVTTLSQVRGVEVMQDAKGLVERGNAMLEQMVADAQKTIKTLIEGHAETGVGDIEALEIRERTAGMLVKRIRATCGLDDVKPSGVVLIGQLRSFDDVKEVKTVDIESQVEESS